MYLRPAADQRIAPLESRQDAAGRWPNRHAYNGKAWVDFEQQGAVERYQWPPG